MARLRIDLCTITVASLPEWSVAPRSTGAAWYDAIAAAGFGGVQGGDPAACAAAGLGSSTSGRLDDPAEALSLARHWQSEGHACATLHVGSGREDEDAALRLAEAVVAASDATGFPLLIETHRATITQDMWRTVQLVRRLPELRFNADLSHWYTGQEMRYGGKPIAPVLDFIQPVLDRTRFLHGRIGNGGSMQIAIDPVRDADSTYLKHWREIWTRTFRAIRTYAPREAVIPLAVELLPAANHYARTFPGPDGALREESDRWQQALMIKELAERWWAETAD